MLLHLESRQYVLEIALYGVFLIFTIIFWYLTAGLQKYAMSTRVIFNLQQQ